MSTNSGFTSWMLLAFLAPALAVGAARMLASAPAPASAKAGAMPSQRVLPGTQKPLALTSRQQQLIAFERALTRRGEAPTPFFAAPELPAPEATLPLAEDQIVETQQPAHPTEVITRPTTTPDVVEAPTLDVEIRLTAVIGGRTPLAVINGRPMRQGEALPGGWSLRLIDAQNRRISIEKDGQVLEIEQTGGR